MAKVQRFRGEDGQYRWHLKDDNNEIICQGEGHPSPEGVQAAVNNVAKEFAQLRMGIGVASMVQIPIEDDADEGSSH